MALRMSLFQNKMSNFTLLGTLIVAIRARVGKNEGSFLSALSSETIGLIDYLTEKLIKLITTVLVISHRPENVQYYLVCSQ